MMIMQGFPDLFWIAALKGTVFIGLAWLATIMLRRQSAATRHFIWSLAMVGLLGLPALLLVTPSLLMRVLPVGLTHLSAGGVAAGEPGTVSFDIAIPLEVALGEPLADALAEPIAVGISTAPVAGGLGKAVNATRSDVPAIDASPVLADQPFNIQIDWAPWAMALMWVWAAGALLLLVRLGYGMVVVGGVARNSLPVTESTWYVNLEAVRRTLGIRRTVRLRQTDRVGVPIVWGVRSPVVILPLAAAEWSPDAQRAVLLHELAHVSRFDALSQGISQIVCAFYWFSPFVWLAAKGQQKEQEHACDDRVLDAGTMASAYANNLLDIVQSLGPIERRGPALAMARSSKLHGRLKAILDPHTRRHRVGRATRIVAGAVALALIIPLAGMRLVEPLPRPNGIALGQLADALPLALADGIADADPRADVSLETDVAVSLALGVGRGVALSLAIRPDTVCRYTDGRKSLSDESDGEKSWLVEWTGDDCRVEVRTEGEVVFADDLRSIVSISAGGFLRIEIERGRDRRDLRVRPRDGELEYRWQVNGDTREFDEAARSWLHDLLIALDRETAFAIDIRFPELWAQGGTTAILQEAQAMSDYARAHYYERTLQVPGISTSEVRLVMAQAADVMTSDYWTSRVLTAVAAHGLEDADIRRSFLTAIEGMESDHFRNVSLSALFLSGPLTRDEAHAIAEGSRSIGSDHHRAGVLQQLVAEPNLDDATLVLVAQSAGEMSSDFNVAQVLTVMVEADRFTATTTQPEVRRAFLNATAAMESDHHLQTVLITLIEPDGLTPGEVALVLDASSTLESDFARSTVLQALTASDAVTNEDLVRTVGLTSAMESDHQKGLVLQAVVGRGPVSAEVREAVIDATGSMSSEFQRNQVLAALALATD